MNGIVDIGSLNPVRYFFAIALLLGLLFALISPEEDRHFLALLLQWQLQSILPMVAMILSHQLLQHLKGFASLNAWVALGVSGALGVTLVTPLLFLVDLWFDPEPGTSPLWFEIVDEWLNVMPPVVLCWLAINAPWVVGFRLYRLDPSTDVPSPSMAETTPFLELVPDDKRGELIYLKSELHYLDVVTTKGHALILYNLKDAIEELPDTLGVQVHRSYWVVIQQIESLTKRGREGEIGLANGDSIPVSRNRLAAVRNILEACQAAETKRKLNASC